MKQDQHSVQVILDEACFRRFTLFDLFIVRRQWVRPAAFAGIMLAFAGIALLLKRDQSGLIAAVLAAIVLALPLVWAGTIISQVNLKAKRLHLKPPRHVYTLTFSAQGIRMRHAAKDEEVNVSFEDITAVYRYRGDYYLYLSPARAFILPAAQLEASGPEIKRFLPLLSARAGSGDRRSGTGPQIKDRA